MLQFDSVFVPLPWVKIPPPEASEEPAEAVFFVMLQLSSVFAPPLSSNPPPEAAK